MERNDQAWIEQVWGNLKVDTYAADIILERLLRWKCQHEDGEFFVVGPESGSIVGRFYPMRLAVAEHEAKLRS